MGEQLAAHPLGLLKARPPITTRQCKARCLRLPIAAPSSSRPPAAAAGGRIPGATGAHGDVSGPGLGAH